MVVARYPAIPERHEAIDKSYPAQGAPPRRGLMACTLSVLKRCVPKTLAFAFGLCLRSKMRCFKTRVLGRRLPDGLRFRALRSKS